MISIQRIQIDISELDGHGHDSNSRSVPWRGPCKRPNRKYRTQTARASLVQICRNFFNDRVKIPMSVGHFVILNLPNYTTDKLIRNRRLDNRLEVHRWNKRKSIGSTISKIYHVMKKDLLKVNS